MMDPTQAFASGTKAGNLASPIPGVSDANANATQANAQVAATDKSPIPAAQPSGTPAPPQPQQNQGSGLDAIPQAQQGGSAPPPGSSDLDAIPQASGGPQNGGPINYDAQDIEDSFLGHKVRKLKNGPIEIQGSDGKWGPPHEAYADAVGSLYKVMKDAPMMGGMMAGSVAGGALGTAGGGPIGGMAGSFLGAAGGAYAGATAARNQNGNLDVGKLPESFQKQLYIMKKLGGVSDDDAQPTSPNMAALFGGLGEITASVGSALKSGAASEIAAREASLAADQAGLSKLSGDNARTGNILTAGDAGIANAQTSGSGLAADAAAVRGNAYGQAVKENYAVQSKQQMEKLKQFLSNVYDRVAPGVPLDNPGELGIAQSEKKGFDNNNIIDKQIDNYNTETQLNRAGVSELARNRQFSAQPLLKETQQSVIDSVPGADKFIDVNTGKTDMNGLRDYLRGTWKNDQAAGQLVDHLAYLDNATSRETAAFGPTSRETVGPSQQEMGVSAGSGGSDQIPVTDPMGSSGGPNYKYDYEIKQKPSASSENAVQFMGPNQQGKGEAGLTFNDFTRLTDKIQQSAADTGIPALKRIAGTARDTENEIVSQVYQGAGQPDMAQKVFDMKKKYSDNIDFLNQTSDQIQKNLSNLGGWVLKMPSQDMKRLVSLVNPSQLAEFRGAAMASGLSEEIALDPSAKLDPTKIKKMFLKDPARKEAMNALFDPETMQDFQSIANVADVLKSKAALSGNTENTEKGVVQKIISMQPKLDLVSKYGRKLVDGMFMGSPKALTRINAGLDQYQSMASAGVGAQKNMIGNGLKMAGRTVQASPLMRDIAAPVDDNK